MDQHETLESPLLWQKKYFNVTSILDAQIAFDYVLMSSVWKCTFALSVIVPCLGRMIFLYARVNVANRISVDTRSIQEFQFWFQLVWSIVSSHRSNRQLISILEIKREILMMQR